MFDPQRLLGQLMGDALSGQLGGRRRKGRQSSGLGSLLGGSTVGKATLGVGLVGIAVAAWQHYSQQQGGGGAAPSPLAGAGFPGQAAGSAMPPPPPAASVMPPPPPPPASALSPARGEQAMLLLRAMITAADADGLIDAAEREAILGRARAAGLDAEDLQTLDAEISAPLSLRQLAARTPEALRDEVYAAALIAITADTEAERRFLDDLAAALPLAPERRNLIHQQLGMA